VKNLVIDLGNSFAKAAIFSEQDMLWKIAGCTYEQMKDLLEELEYDQLIVSSVNQNPLEMLPRLKSHNPLVLNGSTPLPFRHNYATPETLGTDRLAAMAGAYYDFPGRNCLVIDFGTCITYDIMDAQGIYHGGAISPGWKLKFRAMHNFTARLPLIDSLAEIIVPGKSTRQCMINGVVAGTIAEIEGMIKYFKDLYEDLCVVFCGGDANFFDGKVKGIIFVDPDFGLKGLNKILLYNIEHVH
jgi:type III pantothenate kinase